MLVMNDGKVVKITSLIGTTIKLERVKRGWSQENLALESNLSQNSIGAIERGTSVPSVETVEKRASAFGMTFFEFIDLVKLYNK